MNALSLICMQICIPLPHTPAGPQIHIHSVKESECQMYNRVYSTAELTTERVIVGQDSCECEAAFVLQASKDRLYCVKDRFPNLGALFARA